MEDGPECFHTVRLRSGIGCFRGQSVEGRPQGGQGEFGSASKPAVVWVPSGSVLGPRPSLRSPGRQAICASRQGRTFERIHQFLGIGAGHVGMVIADLDQLGQGRKPPVFGEVGAGPNRPPIRQADDIQRPAPLSGQGEGSGHVGLVDIRALFAVYLDVPKVRVHVGGTLGILKYFSLHHVAPVACRVPNADE